MTSLHRTKAMRIVGLNEHIIIEFLIDRAALLMKCRPVSAELPSRSSRMMQSGP